MDWMDKGPIPIIFKTREGYKWIEVAWPPELRCPKCNAPLIPLTLTGLITAMCPKCYTAWQYVHTPEEVSHEDRPIETGNADQAAPAGE